MSSIFYKLEQVAIDMLKAAGHLLEPIALTAVQAAVAAAKATPLGAMAEAAISLVATTALSGTDKQSAVVKLLAPVAPVLMKEAGLPSVSGSIEDFLHELVPSVFNDVQAKATAAVTKVATEAVGAIAHAG